MNPLDPKLFHDLFAGPTYPFSERKTSKVKVKIAVGAYTIWDQDGRFILRWHVRKRHDRLFRFRCLNFRLPKSALNARAAATLFFALTVFILVNKMKRLGTQAPAQSHE